MRKYAATHASNVSSVPASKGLRQMVARRDDYRCHYCGTPSAATIDHIHPRSEGGDSWSENLVLACNYCNQRKSTRDIEAFKASEDWKLPKLNPIPETVFEMLEEHFGWALKRGTVYTSSAHSKIEIKNNLVFIHVRATKEDDWKTLQIGSVDNKQVISLAYEFLKRHFAPKKPKQHYPKQYSKSRGGVRTTHNFRPLGTT